MAMMMAAGMMGGGMLPPCQLLDGISNVNIVINAEPACPGYKILCCGLCCGAQPLHPGEIHQRPGGVVGMLDGFMGNSPVLETVRFNLWAPCGLPAQLAGRVNPNVWADFVNQISLLGATQPNCCMQCAQCLMCQCGAAEARMAIGLQQIEAAFGSALGATAFNHLRYEYQVWIPFQPGNPSADPPVQPTPAHWENRFLDVLRVDFAQPFLLSSLPMQIVGGQQPMMGAPMGMAPAPMMMPGQQQQMMGQPQYQQQPMMQQPQQFQQQPMMQQQQYAQQQPQYAQQPMAQMPQPGYPQQQMQPNPMGR